MTSLEEEMAAMSDHLRRQGRDDEDDDDEYDVNLPNCPVCFELVSSNDENPIQCHNGHLICRPCGSNLFQCYLCKVRMDPINPIVCVTARHFVEYAMSQKQKKKDKTTTTKATGRSAVEASDDIIGNNRSSSSSSSDGGGILNAVTNMYEKEYNRRKLKSVIADNTRLRNELRQAENINGGSIVHHRRRPNNVNNNGTSSSSHSWMETIFGIILIISFGIIYHDIPLYIHTKLYMKQDVSNRLLTSMSMVAANSKNNMTMIETDYTTLAATNTTKLSWLVFEDDYNPSKYISSSIVLANDNQTTLPVLDLSLLTKDIMKDYYHHSMILSMMYYQFRGVIMFIYKHLIHTMFVHGINVIKKFFNRLVMPSLQMIYKLIRKVVILGCKLIQSILCYGMKVGSYSYSRVVIPFFKMTYSAIAYVAIGCYNMIGCIPHYTMMFAYGIKQIGTSLYIYAIVPFFGMAYSAIIYLMNISYTMIGYVPHYSSMLFHGVVQALSLATNYVIIPMFEMSWTSMKYVGDNGISSLKFVATYFK